MNDSGEPVRVRFLRLAPMTAPSLAQQERATICDLFAELGPEAPTLCEGWTTADLAAHLVVREHRPDSGPGIVWPRLAGYTDKVRHRGAGPVQLRGARRDWFAPGRRCCSAPSMDP